jgi:2TM domain
MDQDQQSYQRAHARVQALKGFYIHATVFVLVNIGLFIINLLTGGGWWFYWPLIGWGIGLGAHALGVFGFGGRPWGREWEERKTREFMDQDRRDSQLIPSRAARKTRPSREEHIVDVQEIVSRMQDAATVKRVYGDAY